MNDESEVIPTEMDELKKRAKVMGIKFSPNIGLDKLRDKVNSVLTNADGTEEDEVENTSETETEMFARLKKEGMALVRLRITCMNPSMKAHPGMYASIGNKALGPVTRYIPFDLEWHVPKCLLDVLENKYYNSFYTQKNKNGVEVRLSRQVKELAIEYLPPLTEEEVSELALQQAASNSI